MEDTLTINNPAQLQQAANLAAIFAAGLHRDSRALAATGGLSYSKHAPKCFVHPYAATLLGDAAREHLGGAFAGGDWRQKVQAFQQPSLTDVHVDAVLTQISVMTINTMYIGAQVFPRVQVDAESGVYFVYSAGNFLRNEAAQRAPATRAAQVGYNLTTQSYRVEEWAAEHPIDDRVRNNSDSPLAPDSDAAIFVADKIDMRLEGKIVTALETTANWTTTATLSGTDQWSDYANSDPVDDIKTARLTVLKQIARPANTIVMNVEVFETLAQHPDLLDRVKYTGTNERPAMVTARMMAELFQVDQVLVGAAVNNTATEGASDSIAYMWGKHCWVGYVPSAPALRIPAAGYTLTTGRLIDRYRENAITSDVIRGREAFDPEIVAAGAGYRIINAIA